MLAATGIWTSADGIPEGAHELKTNIGQISSMENKRREEKIIS
jgi:hypothetical protein